MAPIEQEYRFALSRDEFRRLRQALAPPLGSVLQENHYLDTESWALRLRGYGLRLRIEDGTPRLLTLKGPAREEGGDRLRGITRREETESPVPPGTAPEILEGRRPLGDLGLDLPAVLMDHATQRVLVWGRIETRRRTYRPGLPECERLPAFLFELDEVRFPNGRVDHELEVEWQGTAGRALDRALHEFLEHLGIPVRPRNSSKLARLLHSLGGGTGPDPDLNA
ncbi:MAG: CYTH domain-containing protein [Candidatus Eisenbacteria bacterium]